MNIQTKERFRRISIVKRMVEQAREAHKEIIPKQLRTYIMQEFGVSKRTASEYLEVVDVT